MRGKESLGTAERDGVSVDSKLDLSMMREGRTTQQGVSVTAGKPESGVWEELREGKCAP